MAAWVAKTSRITRSALRRAKKTVRRSEAVDTQQADMSRKELEEISKTLKQIRDELKRHRRYIETIQIETTANTMRDVQSTMRSRQIDAFSSLESLTNTGRSFARFGDGEFRLALRPEFNLGFQSNRTGLRDELMRILVGASSEDLLVGFPHIFRDAHWSGVWADVWPELRKVIPDDAVYGDSHVTRPNFFSTHGQAAVEAWRSVWDRKRVCIVAGRDSRFDLIPALFDNVLSVKSIDAPSTQAYDSIDDIEAEARVASADCFLIALGPSGTLLASRLAAAGRQALDIGHLSASYKNVFGDAARPEAL